MDEIYEKIREFHVAFSVPWSDKPQKLDTFHARRRAEWVQSECVELLEADSLQAQADAFMDIVYFAIGGLVEMGVKPQTLFDLVHQANMAKLWEDGKPRIREGDGKILKPPGWTAPDDAIAQEIRRQQTS